MRQICAKEVRCTKPDSSVTAKTSHAAANTMNAPSVGGIYKWQLRSMAYSIQPKPQIVLLDELVAHTGFEGLLRNDQRFALA
jgi:hypothetical protein